MISLQCKMLQVSGSGGATDYSNWTFAYTPDYQTITEGTNELTAKISCFDVSPTPISKYNSVNITGLPSPDTFAPLLLYPQQQADDYN